MATKFKHDPRIALGLAGDNSATLGVELPNGTEIGLATYDPASQAPLVVDAASGTIPGIEIGSADGYTFRAALSEAQAKRRTLRVAPGSTLALDSPITVNIANGGIEGNGASIDCSALGGQTAITVDYVWPSAAAWQKSAAKMHSISNLRLAGPGKGVASSVGWLFNGSTAPLGMRPSMRNIFTHGFETGEAYNNRAFIGLLQDCDIYDCKFGIHQRAADDAGENITRVGGVIHSTDLPLYFQDNSSEWWMYGVSIDYCRQMLVATGAPTRLFFSGHIEPRGKELAGDPDNYVLDGSGTDPRAAVAGKDSFIDVDGNGSLIVLDGWFDINNSGGAAPYAWQQLINVRHKNSKVILRGSVQNMQNTANRLWTGPGRVILDSLHTQHTPTLPSRITDQAAGNALIDGDVNNGLLQDSWFIYKDGAAITSKTTGANGSIARSTVQTDGGSGSLAITKTGVAASPFQVGVIVPVKAGQRMSGYFRAYRSGLATYGVYIDFRWVKRTPSDSAVPLFGQPTTASPFTLGAARSAYFSDATIPATDATWHTVEVPLYKSGASGDECAPEWATDMMVTINMDAPGPGVLYLDKMGIYPQ